MNYANEIGMIFGLIVMTFGLIIFAAGTVAAMTMGDDENV